MFMMMMMIKACIGYDVILCTLIDHDNIKMVIGTIWYNRIIKYYYINRKGRI